MSPTKPLQTFISYSRVNQQFAIKLACELKSAGFPVWMDQFDIPTGARWDDEIERALRESQVFMFIITPDSIASENAKDEVGYAIDHGKRILPVLLEECEVPLRLRRLQHVDFTHKSFNEGIESAKELLSKLIHEIEAPTPVEAGNGAIRRQGTREAPGGSMTAPTKRRSSAQSSYPGLGRQARLTPGLMAAGIGVVALGFLVVAALLLKPLLDVSPALSPTSTSIPTQAASPAASSASPTDIPATSAAEFPRSFTEDFGPDSRWDSDWTHQFRHGSTKKEGSFTYGISDGDLIFDLAYEYVWVYFLYEPSVSYDNVELEAVVYGLRSTDTLGLICQFGNEGWYEFDINGAGFYDVRFVDSLESDHDEDRFLIEHGFSPTFKDSYATKRENTLRVGCDRSDLSLFVNGAEVLNGIPGGFKPKQGQIGIAVRSFENYPIQVVLRSITVREP